MVSIQEKMNEIRQAKKIPISVFERNGISKTKYFAFVRGERDLSIDDFHVMLEILSVSFSELLAQTNELDRWIVSDVLGVRYAEPDVIAARRDQAMRDYEEEKFYGNYQLATLFDFIYRLRTGQDVKQPVDILYKDLKKYAYFNFNEMRILANIGPFLTPKRFFTLYQIYVAGVHSFRFFLPEEMLKIMRHVNIRAFELLADRTVKSAAGIKFVLDSLVAQPRRNATVELHVHHQFATILREYLFGDREVAEQEYERFAKSGRRQDVLYKELDAHAIWDAEQIWRRVTGKADKLVDDFDNTTITPYAEIAFRNLVPDFGTEIRRVIDGKKITVREIERHGFSRTKMYRVLKNAANIHLSELFTMMKIGRIEPGDVDAMLSFHMGSRASEDLVRQFEETKDLQERVTLAMEAYDKTGIRRHLEYALLFQVLYNQRNIPMWPESDEALGMANDVTDMLFDMEEWDETEHRLVETSLLNSETADQAVNRLRYASRQMRHREVFHSVQNSVLKNSEAVLYKFMLARDGEGYQKIMNLVEEEMKRDAHILDFAVWRWRLDLYRTYGGLFTDPDTALGILELKFDDYVTLTGNRFILDNYRNAMRDLADVFARDFTWNPGLSTECFRPATY